MPASLRARIVVAVGAIVASAPVVFASDGVVALTVNAGRPLRVALDRRVVVRQVGQPISATVIAPVYAYDRVVIPAGSTVDGRVARLDPARKAVRVLAMLGGDFSPQRQIVLQFDRLTLPDGRQVPIRTTVSGGIENVRMEVAAADEKHGIVDRAREAVTQQAKDALAQVKGPDRKERVEDAVVRRLPYHPQILTKGTVFDATFVDALDFGTVVPASRAAAGSMPAPESVLDVRLVTPLDSAKTPRGTAVGAVVAAPVFSASHELILPEGASLEGEVTFARHAEHFHRNGQLRFLFEKVDVPDRGSAPLLASLYAAQAGAGQHLAIDDEGGAKVANSNTRFIEPALAVFALRGTLRHRGFDNDGDANDVPGYTPRPNVGAGAVGGFLGFGLIGSALAQVSRPFGIAFAVVGVGRTAYTAIVGKGQEVTFPKDTPIEVQLAPGPGSRK